MKEEEKILFSRTDDGMAKVEGDYGYWLIEEYRKLVPAWIFKLSCYGNRFSQILSYTTHKALRWRIERSEHNRVLSGKGFRPGHGKTFLDIQFKLYARGKLISQRYFKEI